MTYFCCKLYKENKKHKIEKSHYSLILTNAHLQKYQGKYEFYYCHVQNIILEFKIAHVICLPTLFLWNSTFFVLKWY
jgi:hypothetical protein